MQQTAPVISTMCKCGDHLIAHTQLGATFGKCHKCACTHFVPWVNSNRK